MLVNFLFKTSLTLSSISLIGAVYFIKSDYIFCCMNDYPQYISFLIVTFIPVILTILSLICKPLLSNREIEHEPISIEEGTNNFLPSYLGYFFVALSINNDVTFWWIFSIIFLFVYHSQNIYFNPILLIFRYNFYHVATNSNKKIFVIIKKKIDLPNELIDLKLKAINNFTYIEK